MNEELSENSSQGTLVETVSSSGFADEKDSAVALKNKKKKWIIISAVVVFIVAAVVVTIILLSDSGKKNSASASRYYSSSGSSSEMTHDKYCMLYMSVSNVSISHSYTGNYVYCSGTVTNNGNYQIKYVKVKGVFYDRSGNIIDTNWCYAVDSNWLDPGESKTFEMMVKDSYGNISTADVKVVCD